VLGTPKKVFAHAGTLVNPVEVEDCLVAVLEMADRSLASFAITVGSARELSRHRFCFANLVAESNVRPYTNSSDPWKFIGDTPEIAQQIQEVLARFQPGLESFEGQFEQYYRAMSSGGNLPVSLEDARRSIEVVTAAYHSVSTGQDICLPIPRDHPAYTGWSPQRAKN
jgi:predicted dehydrogenase